MGPGGAVPRDCKGARKDLWTYRLRCLLHDVELVPDFCAPASKFSLKCSRGRRIQDGHFEQPFHSEALRMS